MRDREEVESWFLKNTKSHHMITFRDDGVYRHIRFKRPDETAYYFDLITWPGHLMITGDMDSHCFSRTEDMFKFFRCDPDKLSINPGYWAEKLVATEPRSGYESFDKEVFVKALREHVDQRIMELSKEERREVVEHLRDGRFYDVEHEYELYDIYHNIDHFPHMDLTDFFTEGSFKSYTYHYIWCCYAIVWGIQQYDKEKECSSQKNSSTE